MKYDQYCPKSFGVNVQIVLFHNFLCEAWLDIKDCPTALDNWKYLSANWNSHWTRKILTLFYAKSSYRNNEMKDESASDLNTPCFEPESQWSDVECSTARPSALTNKENLHYSMYSRKCIEEA